MKKLSIVDIANHLNISKTTVSFILNGRAQEKRISEELVERVQKFIKEVGYRPNETARGLRTGKSNIIGLMVESISDPFFATIARLIENKAYKNGYKIIYCSTDNDTQKTKDLIQVFRERSVDGYIISPPEGVDEEINELVKSGIPVVMFDRHLPKAKADYVEIDNEYSAFNATGHLIGKGYRNIAFVTFSSAQTQMQGRLKGYKAALKGSGLKAYVMEIDYNPDDAKMISAIKDFFSRHKNLDAVLFGAIQAGVCGLKAMKELDLHVPSNLAVISFDDHDVFELFSPPITAIEQPIEEIAENVIDVLLQRLNFPDREFKAKSIVLKTKLKIRSSLDK